MLSTACPKCGRPTPLSLAAPARMHCPTCGLDGELPANVRAQLDGAQRLLQSIATRDRQLTGQQQRALTSSRGAALGYWLTTGAVGVPLLACGAIGMLVTLGGRETSVAGAAMSIAPIALFVLVAIVGQRSVKQRYAALRIACAAVPPASPGEPAACHVCGGPLPAGGAAIVRCGFCSADNVIAADALAAAAAARATLTGDVETTVRRQATLARSIAKQATVSIVITAVGAPFFTLLASFLLFWALSGVEGPIDPSYRYGLVKTEAGRCIAHVYPRVDGKWLLGFGAAPPAGMQAIEVRDAVDDLPAMSAGDFAGKRVKAGAKDRPPAGVVERVHGTRTGSNKLVIAGADYELPGVCLDEP